MAGAGSDSEPAFAVPGPIPDGVALWLVRHGETTWSRSGQHTGRTELPLTAEGEQQARALRGVLADIRPVLVLCSPRERAQATARLAGLRVDAIDDDLAEWDYGDYEGLTTHEIRQRVPDWSLWTHGVPNGEAAAQVRDRADRVLRRASGQLERGPVVLVAHGHISRVMGVRWIGLTVADGGRLALGTAAPSLLSSQYGMPVIDRWNMPNPATANGDPGESKQRTSQR
jgi:broad specificity phosphatase PhoE